MIKACFPVSPISTVLDSARRYMILARKEDFPHSSIRMHSDQVRSYEPTTQTSCFFREKIRESFIELPQPSFATSRMSKMNTKVLSSLMSLYKKGQICFPPPALTAEQKIAVFSPLPITRKQGSGGLEVIPANDRVYGGAYTSRLLLIPHHRGECSPFYSTDYKYKVGEHWYLPPSSSEIRNADFVMRNFDDIPRVNIAEMWDHRYSDSHPLFRNYEIVDEKYKNRMSEYHLLDIMVGMRTYKNPQFAGMRGLSFAHHIHSSSYPRSYGELCLRVNELLNDAGKMVSAFFDPNEKRWVNKLVAYFDRLR